MGEGDGPLHVSPQTYWDSALILSIFEVILALGALLMTLLAFGFVLRFAKLRMPMLAVLRMILCLLTSLWVGGLLGATAAPWRALRPVVRLTSKQLGDVCWIQLCITHGLVEPSLLTLVVLLFRAKASSPSSWQPWRLLRLSAIVGAVFTVLQAVPMIVRRFGEVGGVVVSPEPRRCVNASVADESLVIAAGDDGDEHPWWRNEGCADTVASLVVSALFVLPFEFFWTVACLRLRRLLINYRLRARLYAVQVRGGHF